jgi:hypothetical protein
MFRNWYLPFCAIDRVAESILMEAHYQSLIARNCMHYQIAEFIVHLNSLLFRQMCCHNFLKAQSRMLGWLFQKYKFTAHNSVDFRTREMDMVLISYCDIHPYFSFGNHKFPKILYNVGVVLDQFWPLVPFYSTEDSSREQLPKNCPRRVASEN